MDYYKIIIRIQIKTSYSYIVLWRLLMDYYKNPNKNQLFLYSFMEIINGLL